MTKFSALTYALRNLGVKGGLAHLGSRLFGDARLNRSASSIDMRIAKLKFCDSPKELLTIAFPDSSDREIELVLLEAREQIKKSTVRKSIKKDFPLHWDSGQDLQIFLYSSIRLGRPKFVIETGTANGKSTSAICKALARNKYGHVWSFDVLKSEAPYVSKQEIDYVTLIKYDGKGSSLRNYIEKFIDSDAKKFFFHDSDHSYLNQFSDYKIASEFAFDLLISDDVDASMAFCDFANSTGSVALDSSKFIGILSNPGEVIGRL